MRIRGWMEIDGTVLSEKEIDEIVQKNPDRVSVCGGEFYLTWDDCVARDHFGIIPGDCPPGKILCKGTETGNINPDPEMLPLEKAIERAVKLRSNDGVVAFSGGVDSALIAKIAERPCVTVGLKGSHDLNHAMEVASGLDLEETHFFEIPKGDVRKALKTVLPLIPVKTPVEASIATTIFFVTRWAHENGYEKVIAGQGADELFGGYARYLETECIEETLKCDFESLERQGRRDQAVAEKNGTYISCPYLDVRVVRAAKALPPESMVTDGIRKYPLRKVASMYMPDDFAFYGKKAMQYGSGIMKEIQKLAQDNGYKNSVQRYIDHLI